MNTWRPGADEFSAEMTAKLSQYLKAGQSLGFDPRSRKLEEQARAGGLNSTTSARRDVDLAAACLGVEPERPGLRPVAGVRRACRPMSSTPRRPSFIESSHSPKDPKAATVHPLVAKVVLASPPSSMAEVVDRYASLFAQLESRWKEQTAKSKRRPRRGSAGTGMGVAAEGDLRRGRAAGGEQRRDAVHPRSRHSATGLSS